MIRLLPIVFALALTACPTAGSKPPNAKAFADVCEEASRVPVDDCGIEPQEEEEGEDVACEGDVEAAAQCVVDNVDDFCAFIDDPTQMNDYTECVGDI